MKAAAAGTLSQPEDQQTVTAPKLEPVDHAVIIRRGDTLWQISRRVYGRGIRYTTIYLANKDQIRDPHWIWPGQIFAVPEETAEGVPADMSAIADQAVPLPEKRQQ
jgi:nucleoid-associated protein YgaU